MTAGAASWSGALLAAVGAQAPKLQAAFLDGESFEARVPFPLRRRAIEDIGDGAAAYAAEVSVRREVGLEMSAAVGSTEFDQEPPVLENVEVAVHRAQ